MQILIAFILVYVFCWGLYFFGIWLDTDYAYMQAERRKARAIRKYGEKVKVPEIRPSFIYTKEILEGIAQNYASKKIIPMFHDIYSDEAQEIKEKLKNEYIQKYGKFFE